MACNGHHMLLPVTLPLLTLLHTTHALLLSLRNSFHTLLARTFLPPASLLRLGHTHLRAWTLFSLCSSMGSMFSSLLDVHILTILCIERSVTVSVYRTYCCSVVITGIRCIIYLFCIIWLLLSVCYATKPHFFYPPPPYQ